MDANAAQPLPPGLVPDQPDRSGWYWLRSPMQAAPVVGFFRSGLHMCDGAPRWIICLQVCTPDDLALRGWTLVGPCLTPAEVEALRR